MNNSASEVQSGNEVIKEMLKVFHEIVELVTRVHPVMTEDAEATEEVTASIDQITKAITDATVSIQNISRQMNLFTTT